MLIICRDNNPIPPRGFTDYLNPNLSQNFHFVGGPSQFAPFKASQTMLITNVFFSVSSL